MGGWAGNIWWPSVPWALVRSPFYAMLSIFFIGLWAIAAGIGAAVGHFLLVRYATVVQQHACSPAAIANLHERPFNAVVRG